MRGQTQMSQLKLGQTHETPSPMATGNGLSGRFSRKALIGWS